MLTCESLNGRDTDKRPRETCKLNTNQNKQRWFRVCSDRATPLTESTPAKQHDPRSPSKPQDFWFTYSVIVRLERLQRKQEGDWGFSEMNTDKLEHKKEKSTSCFEGFFGLKC